MGREVAKDVHDLPRQRFVPLEPGRHDDGVRALPAGLCHWHGAADAERPRLVACSQHHAASAWRPDQHRLAAQFRAVKLLHRRIEGVHVGVNDNARPAIHHQL